MEVNINPNSISDLKLRYLAHDFIGAAKLCNATPRISIEWVNWKNFPEKAEYSVSKGFSPRKEYPDEYVFGFKVKSIIGIKEDQSPIYGDFHKIRINIPAGYPLNKEHPTCVALTPVWHPNINQHSKIMHGKICVAAELLGSWQTLDLLVLKLGKMLQYKIYHAQDSPPYPIDSVIAYWVINYAEPKNIVNLKAGKAVDNSLLSDALPTEVALAEEEQAKPKIVIKNVNYDSVFSSEPIVRTNSIVIKEIKRGL